MALYASGGRPIKRSATRHGSRPPPRLSVSQARPLHATKFLRPNDKTAVPPVAALFGGQRYLKVACLRELTRRVFGGGEDGEARRFGSTADLAAVLSELSTVSMWGDRRLVLVDDADEFVTKHRAALEKYVAKPAKNAVLVLDVKTWPKTTKLAKAVAATGLELDCGDLTAGDLVKWLREVARDEHGKELEADAARLLAELAGPDLGLVERELSKVADFAGEASAITAADVARLVGGGKAESAFKMLGDVLAGDLAAALTELDLLLRSGEAPQRILGAVTFSYRKLAAAGELIRRGTPPAAAVKMAGVFPKDQSTAAAYLQRLGPRSSRFFAYILEADGALRGQGRLPERVVMERLLVKLAGTASRRRQPAGHAADVSAPELRGRPAG